MTLNTIYNQLIQAAQADYDARIAKGISPYSMSSYQFERTILSVLNKLVDTSDWKADNWAALLAAAPEKTPENESGHWAVTATVRVQQAYATPGFLEAYRNHNDY
mgnify:CR=1 FL=1